MAQNIITLRVRPVWIPALAVTLSVLVCYHCHALPCKMHDGIHSTAFIFALSWTYKANYHLFIGLVPEHISKPSIKVKRVLWH